ncbi:MAG TPA: TetR/AcrR family transcriptional regulator [Iamia sp.]|nr:TetR/AcrR family transcriptional regulator [Iamia sp.]
MSDPVADGADPTSEQGENPAAARTRHGMEALWGLRTPSGRGPKQGLTVDAIAEAGVAVADEGGLDAVSMRRVAERLGVGTMSLYTYVPGKPELVEVMLDRVYAEPDGPVTHPDGWRAALEAHAHSDWDLYQRHPWVLHANVRAGLGPNELDRYERALRRVDGIGLTGREMAGVASLVGGYVGAAARRVADARSAPERTGLTDDEWWAARSAILDQVWDAERWPTASRLEEDDAFAPDSGLSYLEAEALTDFEFGLQRVLDGIDALVRSRAEG